MRPNKITISELIKSADISKVIRYKEKLVVSSHYAKEYLFVEPCRLDAITLLFMVRGKLHYMHNLKEYEVAESSVLVNLPDNIVQVIDTEDLQLYAVFISSDFLVSMPTDMMQRALSYMAINQEHRVPLSIDQMRTLLPFLDLVKSTIENPGPETEEIMKSLLQSFLYVVFNMRSQSLKEHEKEGTSASSHGQRRLYDQFMELVSRYHQQERQVQFYADKLHISPKYLSMSVKAFSGKNPSDWIADFVIAEAKSLLYYSDLSVQEVAYRLNFPSQSSFGKFFKQKTGISPLKYARN